MLGHFFKGKFSSAFQQIAQDKETVEKIKQIFHRMSSLLETKEELIKPIFIFMCQESEELCKSVFEEQLLKLGLNQLSLSQVDFIGQLIKAQKTEESYLEKLMMMKCFIFEQIDRVASAQLLVVEKDKQVILNNLIKIFVRSAHFFKEKFPDASAPVILASDPVAVESILQYKV